VEATGESPSRGPVESEADWDPGGPLFTEVEFTVRDPDIEPPPTLQSEDVE
jgi:hypothetical protein